MKEANTGDQKKLLLIDDDPNLILLVKDYLEFRGYQVMTAGNGREALSALTDLSPDMIICDVMMPEMDGYSVCQQLKADPATQDIPVIFLSALDLTFDKVKAFDVGAADYINKPFHPAEVLARVKNQIRIRQQSLQLQAQQAIIQLQSQQLKAAEEKLSALNATA